MGVQVVYYEKLLNMERSLIGSIVHVVKGLAALGFFVKGFVAGIGLTLSIFGVINVFDPSILKHVSLQNGAWFGGIAGLLLTLIIQARSRHKH